MKRRLDFVTNSSSSSYTIALYKDEPEIGKTRSFANRPVRKCNLSAIEELWGIFRHHVSEALYIDIYDKGMTEDIRIKYYQYLFWERFARSYMDTSGSNSDAERMKEAFDEILNCLNGGFSLASEEKNVDVAYPMIPGERYNWYPEDTFIDFVDTYYRDEMTDYLNAAEKTYDTLVEWFENLTGCTWVLTCGWEDDTPPRGFSMFVKSDDGDAYLNGGQY